MVGSREGLRKEKAGKAKKGLKLNRTQRGRTKGMLGVIGGRRRRGRPILWLTEYNTPRRRVSFTDLCFPDEKMRHAER